MKKIVLALAVMMMAGALNTVSAAVNGNDQVIVSTQSIERMTYLMADDLGLNSAQTLDLLKLNSKYYYLFDDNVVMTDRQYRKAWDKYERKLRRILYSKQYTLYLSRRGSLFVQFPRFGRAFPNYVKPVVPHRNYGMTPGRNQHRPMASAPKSNHRNYGMNGSPNNGNRPQANNHDGKKRSDPKVNGKRDDNQRHPQTQEGKNKDSKPQANSGKRDKGGMNQGNGKNHSHAQQGHRDDKRRSGVSQGSRQKTDSKKELKGKGKEI